MLTLIVRQSLKNGTAKTWKLRSNNPTHTFGSSRLADIISICPETKGIQGLFEYRDGHWWYVDMDMAKSATLSDSSAIRLDEEKTLDLPACTLSFTPLRKEADLYMRLERAGNEKRDLAKKFQLFIVRQNNKVVETRIIPLNKKFKPSLAVPAMAIAPVPSEDWHRQTIGSLEVSQKTVTLEDAERIAHLPASQLLDEDSKKGAYVVLGAALLFLTVGIFAPKQETVVAAPPTPAIAQKIVVKNEIRPKRKRAPQAPPVQQVAQQPKSAGPKKESSATGSKVANMVKSISGGRISQLIGKVSAQGAKSANVIFADGVKAGSGASGRAIAAVGNIEQSGRDWGKAGAASGVVISTAGRGGGGSATGMGGLAAGNTGSGGVGLIEEESEITGGLDREIIAQYIKSKLGQILYCYERQLSANPELFGKVAVKFTIGPSGQVEQQLIGDTTLKNATVEGCILNRVASWKFPAPQGGTKVLVTYPFLFKSTN